MTDLLRSALSPRTYRPLLAAGIAASLVCGAFVLGSSTQSQSAIVVPIMSAVPIPAPAITVMPAPIVIAPAEPPPIIAAEPVAEAPAPPRALYPTLDAACVIPDGAEQPASTCAWDDGFPAIAADGSLIAKKHFEPSGPSGLIGLAIQFIDPKTSRVVRRAPIMTEDESAPFIYADEGTDSAKREQARNRLQAIVTRRIAAVQRALDAQKFRSLVSLGEYREYADADAPAPKPTQIYSEIAGESVRIVDPASATVLWRGQFGIAGPKRVDEDAECSGWSLLSNQLWWDPTSRYVVADLTYRTGGCMCPDLPYTQVKRMP